jgi:hypothetical protein
MNEPESGANPIDPCPRSDDGAHMTVLDLRYVSRDRMTGPARDGGRRFLRERTSLSPPSKDGAVRKVQELRERIQCGTYTVDSEAVAAAILARLLGNEEGRDEPLA